jgi:hypothetical protein
LNQDLLETVIANPPQAHKGDTEVSNEKVFRGSSLTGSLRETVEKNLAACYGIDSKVARFLHRAVTEGERTLETGSGLSTIIFAIRKAHHTVVTPNKGEAAAIKEYAVPITSASNASTSFGGVGNVFAKMYSPGSRPRAHRRQTLCSVAVHRLVLHCG